MKWAVACFKFFASLKLAVVLLVVLGIVFGAGTFVESYHGTDAAQALVYRTHWLSVLFILLALNLLASALDRIPWRKKHVGFLTTHLGIILILAGALVSQGFGIEGQLAIQEGKLENRMTLSDPLVQVLSVVSGGDSESRWIFSMDRNVFPWKGQKELIPETPSPFKIRLLTDYPKAEFLETVQKTENGSPALHVTLQGSMATSGHWLLADYANRRSIDLGPAMIRFENEPLKLQKRGDREMGTLKFDFENGRSIEISLDPGSIGKTFSLSGTSYKVKVRQILKDAIVDRNQLLDRSGEWKNPAVELSLVGGGLSERHTVFAKFPEFPTLHGIAPSGAHVRIAYEAPGFSEAAAKNELRFVCRAGNLPRYQIKRGTEIVEGDVELGKEIATGWMDFKFAVDSYLEHGVVEETYSPLPALSKSAEAIPVIQVEFEKAGERKSVWLPQGKIVHVPIRGSDYHVMYGLKTKPMGFSLELRDFIIEMDPGTNRPARFKSEVTLRDTSGGIGRHLVIQMNEPLKHRGFKVYQSAYQQVPGEPDISIFTVARDPGNPLKYLGAIIMMAGIAMFFYVKPFSTLKSSDPKLRNK